MLTLAGVVKKTYLSKAGDVFCLSLSAPAVAEKARAGQIIHIKCGENFLRRPFGVCSVDKELGTIDVCVQSRGKGTKWLSEREIGDTLSVLGPDGNGFDVKKGEKVLLVGGGIGVFPLLFLAKSIEGSNAVLAFRSKDNICLFDEFEKECEKVFLATDDGSEGFKGFAADLTNDVLAKDKFDKVCVCGPVIMMKTVSKVCEKFGIKALVSMEERMGCGVGACLGCAVAIKGKDGELTYKRACVDGPVFDSNEVVW